MFDKYFEVLPIAQRDSRKMDNMNYIDSIKGTRTKTAVICFADGTTIYGYGFGHVGHQVAEICFNTALTGYQEILSDPSYSGQFVTFTFPHIGNIGTTPEDFESNKSYAAGLIVREDITEPSNWRATNHFSRWCEKQGVVGICGIDTRSLTSFIRDNGMPHAVIAHNPKGEFDIPALVKEASEWQGLENADLAAPVSCDAPYEFSQSLWLLEEGFTRNDVRPYKVVVMDFGVKLNILRCLTSVGCDIIVVPAKTTFEEIMAYNPDGVFLSNGPGDPAATGEYVVPVVKKLIENDVPLFGICLGHQIIAIALGGKTKKMKFGHHGANHPVHNLTNGTVEITSMNHGFTVDMDSLPETVEQTHISLFDKTNCGLRLKNKNVFSVQYHPEASPGPQDSFYLFKNFVTAMAERKEKKAA